MQISKSYAEYLLKQKYSNAESAKSESNNSFGFRESTKVQCSVSIPAELAARLRHNFTTQAINHLSV